MRILKITLILALGLCFTNGAFAKTFKIATLSPNGSFWMNTMKEAAQEIQDKTDGRVKFRFYPGGVMGNDEAVMKKIRIGQLQGGAFPAGALSQKAADTQVYNIPMLFNNYDEVDYVRERMDARLEESFGEAGFVTFGLAEAGFAYIMSKKPVITAQDLKKQKVWVPSDDPASQSAAQTFDFSPIALSIGDVLTGLQTDLINTVTTPPIGAVALQWHTQIKHITDVPIAYIYAIVAIDEKAWKKISAEDQAIVDAAFRAAWSKIDKQNRLDNMDALTALKDKGIQLQHPTPEQLATWQNLTKKAADTYVQKAGINPELVKQIHALLKEYRDAQDNAQ